jgi:autotransporter translocation and assembly factor TamB
VTARRLLGRIAIVLGVVVGIGIVGFLFLFTPPGGRVVRGIVERQLATMVRGEVTMSRLDFRGRRIVLHDVELRAPDGDAVALVPRVELAFRVRSLLPPTRPHLTLIAVEDPVVQLRRQPDGRWNLVAALELVEVREPRLRGIRIDELRLARGIVAIRDPAAGALRRTTIEELDARGAIDLDLDTLVAEGTLDARGRMTRPGEAPLAIEVQLARDGAHQLGRVSGSIDAGELVATLRWPAGQLRELELGDVAGDVRFSMPEVELEGERYGPAQLAAAWEGGQLWVTQAKLELPGLLITRDPAEPTRGAAEPPVGFAGTIEIADLAQTIAAVEVLTGQDLPEARGQGRLDLTIVNPITAWGIRLEGELRELAAGPVTARAVRLDARTDDLRQLAELRLDVRAETLAIGERQLREVVAELRATDRRRWVARASVAQPHPAKLELAATQLEGRDVRIDTLTLEAPEASWTLERPAVVRRRAGAIVVEPLALTSDEQRITVAGRWDAPHGQVKVSLEQVELRSIPAALRPTDLALGGTLDGELALARGPEPGVEGSARLRLADGRVGDVRGIRGELDARLADGRATGTFTGAALGGRARGEFDVPASVPPPEGAPIDVTVDVTRLALARAWRVLARLLPDELASRVDDVRGQLASSLTLGGTWPEPRVHGRVRLSRGAATVTGVGRYRDISLVADATGRQIRLRELRARAGEHGTLDASGTATRRGTAWAFRYQLDAELERFPIPLEDPVVATLTARLEGTVSRTRVTSIISVEDVRVRRRGQAPPDRGSGMFRLDDDGARDRWHRDGRQLHQSLVARARPPGAGARALARQGQAPAATRLRAGGR